MHGNPVIRTLQAIRGGSSTLRKNRDHRSFSQREIAIILSENKKLSSET